MISRASEDNIDNIAENEEFDPEKLNEEEIKKMVDRCEKLYCKWKVMMIVLVFTKWQMVFNNC